MSSNKKYACLFYCITTAVFFMLGIILLRLYNGNNVSDTESDYDYTSTDPDPQGTNNLGVHQIFDRTQWDGRPPMSYENITSPVPLVIIKHTGGGQCFSFEVCAGKVQAIQSMSMFSGLPDIKHSFLIGSDGNIYVGRGWNTQNDEIRNVIDIAFIGNYIFDILTPTMIEAAQLLLENGLQMEKLTEDYMLVAHNQTMITESPGGNVYKEIIHWPHYFGKTKYYSPVN